MLYSLVEYIFRYWGSDVPIDQSDDLKVICAGLSRSATMTLKHVIETELYEKKCMHFGYCMRDTKLIKMSQQCALEDNTGQRQKLLRRILNGCVGTTDIPGCLFVDDLMDMYPDAKVVLNLRDGGSDPWYKSTEVAQIGRSWWEYWLLYLIPQMYHRYWADGAWKVVFEKRFGVSPAVPDRVWQKEWYDLHAAWVRDEAKKRGRPLLEWRPSDGYEPLCKFLELPVINKPLPRLNDSAKIKTYWWIVLAIGLGHWVLAIAILRFISSWIL